MKRIVLAAVAILTLVAGIGYYLWGGRTAAGPPPVPAELTDPPA